MEVNEADSVLKPFQCSHCSKSFKLAHSLEQHILNQHKKEKLKTNPFQCSVCFDTKKVTKYFAKKYLLNFHIRRVHAQRCNKCNICLKTFTFPYELRKHQEIHTDKKYKCDVCSKVFSRKHTLQYHLFYGHGQKSRDNDFKNSLKCDICPQEFLLISHLENHVVKQHVVDKEFECDICSKTFVDQKAMEKHRKDHGSRVKYFCDVCCKSFIDEKLLSIHLRVKHNKFFYCDKCLASFRNKLEFDQHLNTKSSSQRELELKCQICNKIVTSQCSLKVHNNFHLKTKIKIKKGSETLTKQGSEAGLSSDNTQLPLPEIKCEHCSKTFVRNANFATHRKQVHPNAMWTCNFEKCTKSFNNYSKLTTHKRMTHSDLKTYGTYVCPICPKSFNLPKKLKSHTKTHLVEKKFKCELCPKTFVSLAARKVHVANKHEGPKPFKCPAPNCGMSFATRGALTPHLVIHGSEKLFKCDICKEPTKEFKSHLSLRQHIRLVHSGDKDKSKRFKNQIVFTCISKECSFFKTGSEKEVAMHYNEKHGLPRVVLFQKEIIKVVNTPLGLELSFTEEMPNYETNRMILKRYKCKCCLNLFSFSLFRRHPEKCLAKCTFKCFGCSKTFKYKNSLNKHVQETHCKQEEN